MKTKSSIRVLFVAVLAISISTAATAQSTSSTVRGTVTDSNGTPVQNATVTITHLPSGSSRTANTGQNGSFFQPGLRVGGPYSVSVRASGYGDAEVDQIYLSPGAASPIGITLSSGSEAMEEIVVTGEATSIRDLNNGVGSAYTSEDISNTPALKRDLIQTVLRDPLAQSQEEGNLSVAGSNPRFNGFAIDGSLQTDDFGLESNNGEGVNVTTATVRSPINLDAVESVALLASDYDVSAQGFTGGLVSVTTKSGTNEWDGSAFYYWQNESFFGDDLKDGDTFDPGDVDEKEYGFTLGGPIIKDKLFFFVSYDEFESANISDFTDVDQQNDIAPGFFDSLGGAIADSLGFDAGSRPLVTNTPVSSERALAKLDWDISDRHRASFTYQSSEEFSTNTSALSFESAWYDLPVDLKAYTLQLYSDWSDSLSTTFRVNQKDFERMQQCRAGRGVGQIEVRNLDVAGVVGTALEGFVLGDDVPNVIAGCDRFRHANRYNDDRLQVLAKADYHIDRHIISAGFDYERFNVFNLFVAQSLGNFKYDNYDGLTSQTAEIDYQNVPSNVSTDGAADWGYDRWAVFAQSTTQLTQDFEISVGLRYETFEQSETPAFVPSVLDQYGVDTRNNIDGKDLLLPRVSFRWTPFPRTTLTGGFGRFSGGDPKVWLSNSFNLPTVFARISDVPDADPTVVPQALLDQVAAQTPVATDAIASNYEIPSDWKGSLRLEQLFDIGSSQDYVFTAQYLYSETIDGVLWTNVAQTALSTGTAPDGRPIYANLDSLGIDNLTVLGNHSEGRSHFVALSLGKRYDFGLDFALSYAYQDNELVTEANSSRGVSNWRGIVSSDRNNPGARPSVWSIEHSFKLNLGYERDFFNTGQSTTRFDIFARRFSGDALAHTFNVSPGNPLFGRARGENPFDTDALYVPTGPGDPAVVYASGFDQDAFFDYADRNIKGRGIIEPFSSNAGWTTVMDLRFQQDIPSLPFLGNSLGDNNFSIVLDIENFLNLLNDDWGRWTDGPRFFDNDIVTADIVSAADVAANGVDGATALTGDLPRTTCVAQNDCVYRFNSFRGRETSFVNREKSVYKIRLGVRFDF